MSAALCRVRGRRDDGFTLVEMLVGVVLVSILFAVVMSMVLAAQRSAELTGADHERTEESRLAMNRVSRELRQATVIDRVVNPMGTGYDATAISAVTFRADFNQDGCINGVVPSPAPYPVPSCLPDDPADPEVLSYCHEPQAVAGLTPRLYVMAGPLPASLTSCAGGQPILAEEVDEFGLEWRSNEYRLDADTDGVTTWEELDAGNPPFGNSNGTLDVELHYVNSVVVHLDLDDGDGRAVVTQLALRNKS